MKRTLKSDLERCRAALIQLAWYATRENFLLGLFGVAIAGLFLGLLIGWWS